MTSPNEKPLIPVPEGLLGAEGKEEERPLTVYDIPDTKEEYVCQLGENVKKLVKRAGGDKMGPEDAARLTEVVEQRVVRCMEDMDLGSQRRLPNTPRADPHFWQDFNLSLQRPEVSYRGSLAGAFGLIDGTYAELVPRKSRSKSEDGRGHLSRGSQDAVFAPIRLEEKKAPMPSSSAMSPATPSSSSGSQGKGSSGGPYTSASKARRARASAAKSKGKKTVTAWVPPMAAAAEEQAAAAAAPVAPALDITPENLKAFGDMTMEDIAKHCDVDKLVRDLSNFLEGTEFMADVDKFFEKKPRKKRARNGPK